MTYTEKLKDPRWQRKRLEVMQRDNFTCRDCGSSDQSLQIHHCGYRGDGPWAAPTHLLLTLCGDCHTARQDIEKYIKSGVEGVMAATGIIRLTKLAEDMKYASAQGRLRLIIYPADEGLRPISSHKEAARA